MKLHFPLVLGGVIRLLGHFDPLDVGATVARKQDKKFECLICFKTFNRRPHAQRHVETVHSNTDKSVRCHVCESSHKNHHALMGHMRRVHKIYDGKRDHDEEELY